VKSIEKSNGAYLMGAFLILSQKKSAQQAWEIFQNLPLLFLNYRDAAPGYSSYKCSILHCLSVLQKSTELGWVKYESFDVGKYRSRHSLEKGDITWIVPNKIVVFPCPSSDPRDHEGLMQYTPEKYSAVFHQIGVKSVIRVDGFAYDPDRFVRNGIHFFDLPFKGPLPPMNVISKFIEIVEASEFPIGVHCKAGLGKSQTLVGMFTMKKFEISAEEYIAWARICRPGSIIGQQQDFIKQLEGKCKMMKKKEVINSVNFTRDTSFSKTRKNSFKSSNSALELRGSMKTFKSPKVFKHNTLGRILFSNRKGHSSSGSWSNIGTAEVKHI
jgi:cell division cycle 14